jgi:hypothetical protein
LALHHSRKDFGTGVNIRENQQTPGDTNIMLVTRVLCLIGMLGLGTLNAARSETASPPNVMHTFDSRTVRAVQSALRKRHYYADKVDGFFGTATGRAIQRFQIDHGLPATPAINESLLVALGIKTH